MACIARSLWHALKRAGSNSQTEVSCPFPMFSAPGHAPKAKNAGLQVATASLHSDQAVTVNAPLMQHFFTIKAGKPAAPPCISVAVTCSTLPWLPRGPFYSPDAGGGLGVSVPVLPPAIHVSPQSTWVYSLPSQGRGRWPPCLLDWDCRTSSISSWMTNTTPSSFKKKPKQNNHHQTKNPNLDPQLLQNLLVCIFLLPLPQIQMSS